MKPKLLTKRQQIGIFNCADPIAVMRDYVSFSSDVNSVAWERMHTASLKKFIQNCKDKAVLEEAIQKYKAEKQKPKMDIDDYIRQYKAEKAKKIANGECEDKDPTTERQKQLFQNLSGQDAADIYYDIRGHIYPEVLIKMLDTFPSNVSKEILLEYGTYCSIPSKVIVRAIDVLGKDAKDIILKTEYLGTDIFNKIFRDLGAEEAKKTLILLSLNQNFNLEDEMELKISRLYSGTDLRDLLKAFIECGLQMRGELISKIFDVCSGDEIRRLLCIAFKNNIDVWYETLDRIVDYFSKEEGKKYLDMFFETSPGMYHYSEKEKKRYYRLLEKKKK